MRWHGPWRLKVSVWWYWYAVRPLRRRKYQRHIRELESVPLRAYTENANATHGR